MRHSASSWASQPIELIGMAASKIFSMIGWIGGDMLAQWEADGLTAEETFERGAHAPSISSTGSDGTSSSTHSTNTLP
jgi:hypothetical protein